MRIWIFDGGERWQTDTLKYGDRKEIEADLQRGEGHTWRGGSLFVSYDLICKMAGKE